MSDIQLFDALTMIPESVNLLQIVQIFLNFNEIWTVLFSGLPAPIWHYKFENICHKANKHNPFEELPFAAMQYQYTTATGNILSPTIQYPCRVI